MFGQYIELSRPTLTGCLIERLTVLQAVGQAHVSSKDMPMHWRQVVLGLEDGTSFLRG